jgi:hypothetical protein
MNISNAAVVQISRMLQLSEQLYKMSFADQKAICEATCRALTALTAEKKAAEQAEQAQEAELEALSTHMRRLMRVYEGADLGAEAAHVAALDRQ